ncbi:hypothetical protein X777_01750, partial [Ooceraea biroi]
FSSMILWTDEATFTRRGIFNSHNSHVWAHNNPHTTRQRNFQHEFRCNVWMGMLHDRLIGPFFLPDRLNGESFRRFLSNDLPILMENVPLQFRQNSWIQLDGCPSHYARQVRNWLDEHCAHRWIGRGGPVFWPPRSPDLTPLDFYLWGTLKNKVYSTEVISLEDLKQRITNSVTEMQHFQECRTVTNFVLRRCLACIDVQGQHFEMRH